MDHRGKRVREKKPIKLGSFIGKALAYLVMGVFAFMTIYPLVWLLLNSFKTTTEFRINMTGLPIDWTFENYRSAWKIGEFDKLIGNSVLYTLGSSIGITFLSLLSGFAFAKIKSKATGPIYGSFIIGILLSIQSLMVPLFLEVTSIDRGLGDILRSLGLIGPGEFRLFHNSRFGVLIIYIGSALPTGIYLCTEYIRGIPNAIIEAAQIDGAGYFRIFRSIIVGMSKPIAMTLSILNIPSLWNEFALINILVSETNLKSLPLGIYKFSGGLSSDYGKQFAALVIGMLPMLLFYIAFRKQITAGVSMGALKE
ncbi:MAG: carbohydrate ABC transporter permease [Spirochaetaceae bacterium]|nr:carbohydrate ABC transporter permease [Spirochaetaceae bacterium]